MTTVAVLCESPNEGVLADLAASTPLTDGETADLYAAMCADVFRAVETSASDLLVNYRPDESGDPEAELRALADAALDSPDAVRYEKQVGSTVAARVGNTITHLLDSEEESSAMVIEPTAPFLTRGDIDGLAMKLRRSDVVLGPASEGRVYAAGFSSTIDFTETYTPPAIETLTARANDADLDVDYGPMNPVIETAADLTGALALVRARDRAGRGVPQHTAECLDGLDAALVEDEGDLTLRTADTDRS